MPTPVIYQDRLARLPEWAKTHISNLERNIIQLQIALTQATTGEGCPPDAAMLQVSYATGRSYDPWAPSRHRTVRFMLGERENHDFIEVRIERPRGDGKCLSIYGGSSLSILPSSSNVAYVKFA